jgi:hypothetical protein
LRRVRGFLRSLSVACAVAGAWAQAAPPPCKPTALLEGDARAAESVSAELTALGVSTEPRAGCRATTVYVASEDQGFRLAIPVSSGYAIRTPGSAAGAARVIATLLTDVPLRRPLAVPIAPGTPAKASASRALYRFAAELTLGEHDAGLAVVGSVCGRAGVVCLGGLMRASNAAVTGGLVPTARTELDLLVDLEEPFHAGPVMITPWEGVGGGLLRTYLPQQPPSTLFGPSCTQSFVGCASQTAQSQLGIRLEAGLAASVPIGEGVSLTAHAAWTFAPAAHTAIYLDSSVNNVPLLPGEPLWLGHAGFGLQFD